MRRSLVLLLPLLALTACVSWRPQEHYDGWTLYTREASPVEPALFEAAFEPAFEVVENAFGPFERTVRVHAWHGAVELDSSGRGLIRTDEDSGFQNVPGIGLARVQAFHARGGSGLIRPSGIFIGTTETGTAVHELVHARLAELGPSLPLWLEEGLAMFLGDGLRFEGRWIVDGLACWPLRELREEQLDDAELKGLIELRLAGGADLRKNVLVHFVGWAIVFDLFREEHGFKGQEWISRYREGITLEEARTRVDRTLAETSAARWLSWLSNGNRERRLAATKSIWKLRDPLAGQALADALSREKDPTVRTVMAVNALAASGEPGIGWGLRRRLWGSAIRALRDPVLPEEHEVEAARTIYRANRMGGSRESVGEALEQLEHYWGE